MQSSENNNKESSPAKDKIQDHTQAYEQKHSDFHGFTMCLKHAEVMFLDRKDFLNQALMHSENIPFNSNTWSLASPSCLSRQTPVLGFCRSSFTALRFDWKRRKTDLKLG